MARIKRPPKPPPRKRSELVSTLKGIAWLVAIPLAVVGLIGLVEVGWAWWIIALLWAPTGLLVLANVDSLFELGDGGDGSGIAGADSRDDEGGGGGADATA